MIEKYSTGYYFSQKCKTLISCSDDGDQYPISLIRFDCDDNKTRYGVLIGEREPDIYNCKRYAYDIFFREVKKYCNPPVWGFKDLDFNCPYILEDILENIYPFGILLTISNEFITYNNVKYAQNNGLIFCQIKTVRDDSYCPGIIYVFSNTFFDIIKNNKNIRKITKSNQYRHSLDYSVL